MRRRRALGVAGGAHGRVIADGSGWRILDVTCTCGVDDPVVEERHGAYSLALVLGGAFRYRGERGSALLTAGSILLGSAGASYECWHDHGDGDRCLAVQLDPDVFVDLHAALDARGIRAELPGVVLPTHRATTGLFAAAEALAAERSVASDRGLELAAAVAEQVLRLVWHTPAPAPRRDGHDARRIAELARWIEADPAAEHRLPALAARCEMSRFHFLRRFREVTGLTPHAFVRRARLRDAGVMLLATDARVSWIALESGFADLSTFNAAFRQHFGVSPRAFRRVGR